MIKIAIDRVLDDPFYDNIDHAIGRPKNPADRTTRNFYGTAIGSEQDREFAASPYWSLVITIPEEKKVVYTVTEQGRLALRAYLKKQGLL